LSPGHPQRTEGAPVTGVEDHLAAERLAEDDDGGHRGQCGESGQGGGLDVDGALQGGDAHQVLSSGFHKQDALVSHLRGSLGGEGVHAGASLLQPHRHRHPFGGDAVGVALPERRRQVQAVTFGPPPRTSPLHR
jgi:hypothetical protein